VQQQQQQQQQLFDVLRATTPGQRFVVIVPRPAAVAPAQHSFEARLAAAQQEVRCAGRSLWTLGLPTDSSVRTRARARRLT
jgi:hypothetical protein